MLLKQLRKRFVLTAMIGMLFITLLVVGSINLVQYLNQKKQIDNTLDFIASTGGTMRQKDFRQKNNNAGPGEVSDGENPPSGEKPNDVPNDVPDDVPDNLPPEKPDEEFEGDLKRHGFTVEDVYSTRFFTAFFDADGNLTDVYADNIAALTEEEAKSKAEELYAEGDTKGSEGSYHYIIREKDGGYVLIYLDCSDAHNHMKGLLIISLVVALGSLTLEFIILVILSKRVVYPVVESVMKQKSFITDASHELKTPLTIISANTEVLELTEGENEWTQSIKNQTTRLTKLINEMVYLAKADEERKELSLGDFNLSEAVYETVMPYETVAVNKGFKFEAELAEKVNWCGDEAEIRKLLSILMDNAMKYTANEGGIKVSFYTKGKKAICKVFNNCDNIAPEDMKKLFERFYRVDKSRSRETGGSGIGLSIAKAIADSHKNLSISVSGKEKNTIEFKLVFEGIKNI